MSCQVESEATQSQMTREYTGIRFKIHNQNPAFDWKQIGWRQLQKCLETCTGVRVGRPQKLSAVAGRVTGGWSFQLQWRGEVLCRKESHYDLDSSCERKKKKREEIRNI